MGVSRGDIAKKILLVLQKNPGYQGAFTPDKVSEAIQDCMDYISVEMFMGSSGWMNKLFYLDSVANVRTVALPPGLAIVNAVRFLDGDKYVPIIYDDQARDAQVSSQGAQTQFPSRYRIVENKLYFNPAPVLSGFHTIELEGASYPDRLLVDGQMIDPQFDYGMVNYIKWRGASQLVSSVGKANPEWQRYEGEWYDQMMKIINKRIRPTISIKEFDG